MLISSWFFGPATTFAQFESVDQLEIPVSGGGGYNIVSNRSHGLIMFRILSTISNNHVELIQVDTTFKVKWAGQLQFDRNWSVVQYSADDKTMSLLLRSENSSNRDFRLMQVDLNDQTYIVKEIKNLIPFIPTQFEATSKGVLLGGYFSRVPVVIFFNLRTNVSRILPGLFNEPGELTQVMINDDDSFAVLISAKNYLKQRTLWIKNYDPEGHLKNNVMLEPGQNSLIFGRTVRAGSDNNIIAGVYGTRNGDYSRGLFIARVDNEGEQHLNYYSFGDLENFFNYMKARREARVKARIARKKIKGKKVRFSYRFLVHELVPYKDHFILLGEAFYPKYRLSERRGSGLMGASQMVFDGYQYTHAVVLGINANGSLIWDNSFEINDVHTYMLQQFVKMDPQEDQIALLYLYNNEIRSKIIRDNQVLEGKSQKQLASTTDDEAPEYGRVRINNLDYWFKDTFYTYGTRTKITSRANDRSRSRVFFINKICYR